MLQNLYEVRGGVVHSSFAESENVMETARLQSDRLLGSQNKSLQNAQQFLPASE